MSLRKINIARSLGQYDPSSDYLDMNVISGVTTETGEEKPDSNVHVEGELQKQEYQGIEARKEEIWEMGGKDVNWEKEGRMGTQRDREKILKMY